MTVVPHIKAIQLSAPSSTCTLCLSNIKSSPICGYVLYLWNPEGNVWFVKTHSQKERTVLIRLALQEADGLICALHVWECSQRLLCHIHCTQ